MTLLIIALLHAAMGFVLGKLHERWNWNQLIRQLGPAMAKELLSKGVTFPRRS